MIRKVAKDYVQAVAYSVEKSTGQWTVNDYLLAEDPTVLDGKFAHDRL